MKGYEQVVDQSNEELRPLTPQEKMKCLRTAIQLLEEGRVPVAASNVLLTGMQVGGHLPESDLVDAPAASKFVN